MAQRVVCPWSNQVPDEVKNVVPKGKICTVASALSRVNAQWAQRAAASGRSKNPGLAPKRLTSEEGREEPQPLLPQAQQTAHANQAAAQADAGLHSPRLLGKGSVRLEWLAPPLLGSPDETSKQTTNHRLSVQGKASCTLLCCSIKFPAGTTYKDQLFEGTGELRRAGRTWEGAVP